LEDERRRKRKNIIIKQFHVVMLSLTVIVTGIRTTYVCCTSKRMSAHIYIYSSVCVQERQNRIDTRVYVFTFLPSRRLTDNTSISRTVGKFNWSVMYLMLESPVKNIHIYTYWSCQKLKNKWDASSFNLYARRLIFFLLQKSLLNKRQWIFYLLFLYMSLIFF
jgi:hypothetical protein